MDLLKRVEAYISRERLLRPESRVVVAVSGGPDSLSLLHLLQRLSAYRLHIAHLDHGLRSESAAEAEFVRKTAEAWGLPVTVGEADLGGPERQSAGLEEAAREVRYRFLVRVAKQNAAEAILTGHTATDQAETIVMHFLRGAGVHGLQGMRPRVDLSEWSFLDLETPLHLVRPLLQCTREEILEYCERHGLSPRQDPSNVTRDHMRNRVRLDLIPVLEDLQPALGSILPRTGRVMRATADLLDELTEEAMQDTVRAAGKWALALDRDPYLRLPLALRWGLLRRLVGELEAGLDELNLEKVERAQAAIEEGLKGRYSVIADLELEAAGSEIVLRKRGERVRFPQAPQIEQECEFDAPADLQLADGWRLNLSVEPLSGVDRTAVVAGAGRWADPYREVLDARKLPSTLWLRAPREGDRFQPLGMEGSMALSDFLSNEGIPRLQRERWPVLASDGMVFYVVGLRLAHPVRVSEKTDEVLHVELHSP